MPWLEKIVGHILKQLAMKLGEEVALTSLRKQAREVPNKLGELAKWKARETIEERNIKEMDGENIEESVRETTKERNVGEVVEEKVGEIVIEIVKEKVLDVLENIPKHIT